MDKLALRKVQADQIIKHCLNESPDEACGILTGINGEVEKVFEMKNVEKSPIRYNMDPQEQFSVLKEARKDGQEIVGIYHSHTASRAFPSKTDIELAFYPEAAYVIVSLENKEPYIKAFKIQDKEISEIELEVKE